MIPENAAMLCFVQANLRAVGYNSFQIPTFDEKSSETSVNKDEDVVIDDDLTALSSNEKDI